MLLLKFHKISATFLNPQNYMQAINSQNTTTGAKGQNGQKLEKTIRRKKKTTHTHWVNRF